MFSICRNICLYSENDSTIILKWVYMLGNLSWNQYSYT